MINQDRFENALAAFIKGCDAIRADYFARNGYQWPQGSFEVERLRKNIRIVLDAEGQGRSAYCFIDPATGDVLKPASWKVPAKHARGNIFDADNGLKHMGPHGPAYLR